MTQTILLNSKNASRIDWERRFDVSFGRTTVRRHAPPTALIEKFFDAAAQIIDAGQQLVVSQVALLEQIDCDSIVIV